MARKLSFERIGTTEDTDDPVIRATLEDTGSFLDAIIPDGGEEIRVWFVQSNHQGDMKIMLDEIVAQLDETHVLFLSPLTDRIDERLHGFERRTHEIVLPEGTVEEQEILEGE